MERGKKLIRLILSLLILITQISSTAGAKSVYVISNINGQEVRAYKVDANSLIYQDQADYTTTYTSPVGLTVEESGFLFVTFEGTPGTPARYIEIINAKSMQYVDAAAVEGATNLAGIVADNGKKVLE